MPDPIMTGRLGQWDSPFVPSSIIVFPKPLFLRVTFPGRDRQEAAGPHVSRGCSVADTEPLGNTVLSAMVAAVVSPSESLRR